VPEKVPEAPVILPANVALPDASIENYLENKVPFFKSIFNPVAFSSLSALMLPSLGLIQPLEAIIPSVPLNYMRPAPLPPINAVPSSRKPYVCAPSL